MEVAGVEPADRCAFLRLRADRQGYMLTLSTATACHPTQAGPRMFLAAEGSVGASQMEPCRASSIAVASER